jgi:hypothetical protein
MVPSIPIGGIDKCRRFVVAAANEKEVRDDERDSSRFIMRVGYCVIIIMA